jgi:DNA-binding winged helix-turn-helix (wHTH) protein
MSSETTGRVFQFGVFEVNEAMGELRKHGVRIKLHSQPFKVLVLLLGAQGGLVTRKEMQQRLWGDDTFVDFEHGLNAAVNKIREALDDSAAQPRFVETVPGKGYRFISPLALVGADLLETEQAGVEQPEDKAVPAVGENWTLESALLTTTQELPLMPKTAVRKLLFSIQLAYLCFYFGALGNLEEIREIFQDSSWMMVILVITASVLIPVRLYLGTALIFDFSLLPEKFKRLFPLLLPMDLLWAGSPFLLIHHVSVGLALGMSAALVYLPFAQRSLVLMYGRVE